MYSRALAAKASRRAPSGRRWPRHLSTTTRSPAAWWTGPAAPAWSAPAKARDSSRQWPVAASRTSATSSSSRSCMIPEDDLLPDAAPGVHPLAIPVMMQVTEFSCGGFVVGLVYLHTIADGQGVSLFINAVGDYARGLPKPRVAPIWARALIPRPPKLPPLCPQMYLFPQLAFDLSSNYIKMVKTQSMESTGQRCSAFDVAAAATWQARTRSLRLPDPSACVSLSLLAGARHLCALPGTEGGAAFYGNCYYPMRVVAESGAVALDDVTGVVGLVRDARARLAAEFARWAAGDMKEDPYERSFSYDSLFVTDWRNLGFLKADYGMGTPSHVVPLTYYPSMPAAIICRPPVPVDGCWIKTHCVMEEHLQAFKEETKELQKTWRAHFGYSSL